MSSNIFRCLAIKVRRPFVTWICLVCLSTRIIVSLRIPWCWFEHVSFSIITHRKNKLSTSLISPCHHDTVKSRTRANVKTFLITRVVLINVHAIYDCFQNTNWIIYFTVITCLKKRLVKAGKKYFIWVKIYFKKNLIEKSICNIIAHSFDWPRRQRCKE